MICWQKNSNYSRTEFVCFSFHVGLLVIMLSSLKLCSLGGTSVFVLNVITAHLSDLTFTSADCFCYRLYFLVLFHYNLLLTKLFWNICLEWMPLLKMHMIICQ